jgi:nucleoside-diphosphate-sugar epimerase
MRILMIGGTGLISTYLTTDLLAQGHAVTLYNRGQSIYPTPAEAVVLHGDRTNYPAFEAAVRDAGCFDAVIDMVGYEPEDGHSVVRAFRGHTGQFIFCSTVDVYGKPATRYPYREDESYGGLNTYSRSKVDIEKTLWEAYQQGDFPLTIIRPAYTYGEGRGPLYPLGSSTGYLERLRRGRPVIVHGDGTSLWTACHASDVAHAFANAIGNPKALGNAYHTAGEEWMTWDTYHQQVAQAIGAPAPTLVHIPTDLLVKAYPERAAIVQENFLYNNIFDNSAARADLGFAYTIPWVEGVRRMDAWLQAHKSKAPAQEDLVLDRMLLLWKAFESAVADDAWSLNAP